MTLAIYSELTIFAFFSLLTVVFLALWFVIFFLTFFEASTSYGYFHYVSYGIFPQWFSLNQIFGFVCYCGRKNRPSHGQCFMHQSILTVPCAPPPPPPHSGLLRGICLPCQSGGWGICKFCAARGPGTCQPRGHSRGWQTRTRFAIKILLHRGF